jgi:hypothetical protein
MDKQSACPYLDWRADDPFEEVDYTIGSADLDGLSGGVIYRNYVRTGEGTQSSGHGKVSHNLMLRCGRPWELLPSRAIICAMTNPWPPARMIWFKCGDMPGDFKSFYATQEEPAICPMVSA